MKNILLLLVVLIAGAVRADDRLHRQSIPYGPRKAGAPGTNKDSAQTYDLYLVLQL